MTAVDVALARAAAGDLRDEPTHRPVGIGPGIATDVLGAAAQHRITGLLAHAAEQRYVLADDEFLSAVREQHLAALRTCLRCEAVAASVTVALRAAGIDSRVLKGVAMAHLDYPDPSLRAFGDADVLVRRADLAAALKVLVAAGFTRDHPPVRGWWERRFGKAVVLTDAHGVELDLHLTVAGGYYGLRIPSDELFVAGDGFEVAGIAMTALPRPVRLVHAALHAVLGGGSGLRAMRDVAQLAVDATTLGGAREAARGWGCEPVLAMAITRAWSALSLSPQAAAFVWATEFAATADDVHRMAVSTDPAADGWAGEGRTAAAALGPLDRLAYTFGLAVPSRASLRARQRTLTQHLGRVLRHRHG